VKPGESFIIFFKRNAGVFRYSGKEMDLLMHEHGMNPGMMQQKDMIMTEMWDSLTDDQKKTLMKRMMDAKIMVKEGMIKHFQFKIETLKMVKKMLDEC
jgi:hypothetical protein